MQENNLKEKTIKTILYFLIIILIILFLWLRYQNKTLKEKEYNLQERINRLEQIAVFKKDDSLKYLATPTTAIIRYEEILISDSMNLEAQYKLGELYYDLYMIKSEYKLSQDELDEYYSDVSKIPLGSAFEAFIDVEIMKELSREYFRIVYENNNKEAYYKLSEIYNDVSENEYIKQTKGGEEFYKKLSEKYFEIAETLED